MGPSPVSPVWVGRTGWGTERYKLIDSQVINPTLPNHIITDRTLREEAETRKTGGRIVLIYRLILPV